MYIKRFERYHINPYSGLTEKESFELELEIYNRLKGYPHFPKLLRFGSNWLQLQYVGKSFHDIKQCPKFEPDKQIDAIFKTLNKCNIVHLDLHSTGKNICVKNKTIYLIDFDIAIVDNYAPTPELLERLSNYKEEREREAMRNIILNKMLPIADQFRPL
jgi:predicted Ser/Thr protein kinase